MGSEMCIRDRVVLAPDTLMTSAAFITFFAAVAFIVFIGLTASGRTKRAVVTGSCAHGLSQNEYSGVFVVLIQLKVTAQKIAWPRHKRLHGHDTLLINDYGVIKGCLLFSLFYFVAWTRHKRLQPDLK